ncbi:class I SAM-dependent RNA methyltransferase [Candidatus Saccharibacteria bacterium]|nr:class I SAM-dependent RNA methyltransferase [Candidatus Saccharibacteria bacterium]
MEKEPVFVEKIVPGGEALGQLKSGKKIFFWGALPHETVLEYIVLKNKSSYTKALATKISNYSEYRAKPKDKCFLSTSPWQIINYDYELQLKQELVVEMFREHSLILPTPQIFTDHKDYFYRNKMEYALYWNKETNKIELAFHERGSHRKIPIKASSIERPEIFSHAKAIIDDLNARGEEARKYQTLLLRCNQKGEVSGGLYENYQPHPVFRNLTDEIMGKTYSYSPNGFFQINLPVYEMALKEIKKHITTDEVLDLYAGVGTIGLSTAPDKNLTLVECDKHAYRELCENCKEGVFEGGPEPGKARSSAKTPVATGVLDAPRKNAPLAVFAKSEEALNFIQPTQTVILDPPRAGCDQKLINKLLDVCPPVIIYLSCNPATQARDVKLLLEKYKIKSVQTFNFFPHTPHIENLIVLSL